MTQLDLNTMAFELQDIDLEAVVADRDMYQKCEPDSEAVYCKDDVTFGKGEEVMEWPAVPTEATDCHPNLEDRRDELEAEDYDNIMDMVRTFRDAGVMPAASTHPDLRSYEAARWVICHQDGLHLQHAHLPDEDDSDFVSAHLMSAYGCAIDFTGFLADIDSLFTRFRASEVFGELRLLISMAEARCASSEA